MAKVPLIQSAPLSEFGDLPTSPEFLDPSVMDRDQSYVPGFSEMRRDRDIKVGEFRKGKIDRAEVPSLPVNLRWARVQNKKGEPDSSKPFTHGRKGYRLVNAKTDVGQDWLKELPPGSQKLADGSIRNGDCVLMVADAKDAARNDAIKRRVTQERLGATANSFEQNLQATRVPVKGNDPFVERLSDKE